MPDNPLQNSCPRHCCQPFIIWSQASDRVKSPWVLIWELRPQTVWLQSSLQEIIFQGAGPVTSWTRCQSLGRVFFFLIQSDRNWARKKFYDRTTGWRFALNIAKSSSIPVSMYGPWAQNQEGKLRDCKAYQPRVPSLCWGKNIWSWFYPTCTTVTPVPDFACQHAALLWDRIACLAWLCYLPTAVSWEVIYLSWLTNFSICKMGVALALHIHGIMST